MSIASTQLKTRKPRALEMMLEPYLYVSPTLLLLALTLFVPASFTSSFTNRPTVVSLASRIMRKHLPIRSSG
jgi:ABC-type sugar transport system permease subunit